MPRPARLLPLVAAGAATLLAAAGPSAALGPAAPVAAAGPTTARLGGATRYETAAAIADEAARPESHPWRGTEHVVIVRGDRPLDAVARGADSTVFLPIPPRGPVPAAVRAAFAHRAPSRAAVVGDARSLSDAQVRALVGRTEFYRDTRTVLTASADSGNAYRGSDDQYAFVNESYVVSPRVVAEAAAAAHLWPWPVVVLPDTGPADARVGSWIGGLVWVGPLTRIGSVRAPRVIDFVTGSTVRPVNWPTPTFQGAAGRLTGADRYETAALVARRAYPDGARTVYLADGRGVDAAFGVGLPGPVLLVPPGDTPPPSVRDALAALRPSRLVALGDSGVVSDAMLAAAAAETPAPDRSVAAAAAGQCLATNDGEIRCRPDDPPGPSPSWPVGRRALQVVGKMAGRVVEMTSTGYGSMCARTDAGAVACTPFIEGSDGLLRRHRLVTPAGLERDIVSIRLVDETDLYAVTRDGRLLHVSLAKAQPGAATPVPEAGDDVHRVAPGGRTMCVLTTSSTVHCWGDWYDVPMSADRAQPSPREPMTHAPTLVPNLPEAITDIDLTSDLLLRTVDGRVYKVPMHGLTHPGRERTEALPHRVVEGTPLNTCVPTLVAPDRLTCLASGDTTPRHRAAGPVLPAGAGRYTMGDAIVVLADGRAQWLSELPTADADAGAPPLFVLEFGG